MATENGKELMEVVNEGVYCEVLSWKMDVEEPTAASVISAALNQASDLAMRTTEWSALCTLKGDHLSILTTRREGGIPELG